MPPQPYLDHVQIAAPPGCEAQVRHFYDELPHVRRFFTDDPWGNRLELLAPAG
jgi:NAD-dependent oxidoreductase involved in siderophore biosynthesis